MTENLIHFKNIDWESPQKGVQEKIYSEGEKRLRLLKLEEDFVEKYWCLKGHIGFVVEGEMKIDFDGKIEEYKQGDGLWINEGEPSRHKVMIEKGKYVLLILFELV